MKKNNMDPLNFPHKKCPLSVRQLQTINFQSLTLSQKLKIIEQGPPRPSFNIKVEKNIQNIMKDIKKQVQMVHSSKIYKEYDWCCGCERKRVFYCFPCLLIGHTISTAKSVEFSNQNSIKIHSKSEKHVKNALDLAMLGKTVSLHGTLQDTIHKLHRNDVQRNRSLFLKIAKGFIENAGLYEYVLNGELSTTANLEPCSMMDILFKVDSSLKESYEHSPLFKTINTKDIEKQILQAAFRLYQTKILEEVNSAKFVALITEEITDLAKRDQLVIILRYIMDNRVVERYWTTVKPSEKGSDSIIQSILLELDTILPVNKEKLIAQSHIGGVVFSPLITDASKSITEKYKNAIYVHYHAYKLTEVMERAVCQNSRVRDFFANLYGIFRFFEKQPKILQTFFDSTPLYSEGSFEKGALVFIYENKCEVLNFMVLLHKEVDSSLYSVREAIVCKELLVDDGFLYFLSFFYYLMADVNVFYESLQNSFVDSVKIAEAINEFLDEIRKTKDAIAVESSDNDDKTSEAFLRAFAKIEVCNVILKEIYERFNFTNHWEAHILFKSEQYYKFHGNFPETILNNAIEYFKFQYPDKLRVELQTLYTRTDLMVCRNAHDLLFVFHSYKLTSVFEKTMALLNVILTIPTMLKDAENKICAVRRVRRAAALASNNKSEVALTMLLAERDTLASYHGFSEKLIDVFAQQERREIEFTSY